MTLTRAQPQGTIKRVIILPMAVATPRSSSFTAEDAAVAQPSPGIWADALLVDALYYDSVLLYLIEAHRGSGKDEHRRYYAEMATSLNRRLRAAGVRFDGEIYKKELCVRGLQLLSAAPDARGEALELMMDTLCLLWREWPEARADPFCAALQLCVYRLYQTEGRSPLQRRMAQLLLQEISGRAVQAEEAASAAVVNNENRFGNVAGVEPTRLSPLKVAVDAKNAAALEEELRCLICTYQCELCAINKLARHLQTHSESADPATQVFDDTVCGEKLVWE